MKLLLNTDKSLPSDIADTTLELMEWQEHLRFSTDFETLELLDKKLPDTQPRIAFLGSGDFHHLSLLLLKRHKSDKPLHVVVFDNHPDNMIYPFGIHCGSWVYHAAKLKNVSKVTLIGVTSSDIKGWHIFENHLGLLRSGKVQYFCLSGVSAVARAMSGGGIKDMSLLLEQPDKLMGELKERDASPIYLSIDKDVLLSSELKTNLDQGILNKETLLKWITQLAPYVQAADICGEVSEYRFKSMWKRCLCSIDEQNSEHIDSIQEHQAKHVAFNRQVLAALNL